MDPPTLGTKAQRNGYNRTNGCPVGARGVKHPSSESGERATTPPPTNPSTSSSSRTGAREERDGDGARRAPSPEREKGKRRARGGRSSTGEGISRRSPAVAELDAATGRVLDEGARPGPSSHAICTTQKCSSERRLSDRVRSSLVGSAAEAEGELLPRRRRAGSRRRRPRGSAASTSRARGATTTRARRTQGRRGGARSPEERVTRKKVEKAERTKRREDQGESSSSPRERRLAPDASGLPHRHAPGASSSARPESPSRPGGAPIMAPVKPLVGRFAGAAFAVAARRSTTIGSRRQLLQGTASGGCASCSGPGRPTACASPPGGRGGCACAPRPGRGTPS